MKLGDNMTMEACNVWGDVCSRKCRPPRIGDIPRHGAVDEESPGSSSNKLTEAISKYDPRKNLLVVLEKDEHQGQSPPGTANLHDLYFMRQDTNETSLDEGYMRSDTILAKSTSPVSRDAKDLEMEESRVTIRLTAMSVENSRQGTLKSCSPGESPRIPSSPDDLPNEEILEVRKDSALFLEEAEGLPTLREILKSRGPTFVRPRRESSGYSSTLGTFDEDRRNSSAGGEAQQDLTSLLKERRRSSRLISKLPACRAEESLGEESFNIGAPGSNERMPPSGDQLRKLSSAGLEMPNIEEVREVVKEETPSAARSAREGLNELCHLVENVSVEVSSDCCFPGDHPSNCTNSSENGDQGRWLAREYLSTAMISGEPSAPRVPGGPFDGTSPTNVVGSSRIDSPSAAISPRSNSRSRWDSNPGSGFVQQSVDALTTMALEITACVTAKNSSVEKFREIGKNTSLEAKLEPHLLVESRLKENEDLERCSPSRARSNIVQSDATLLPRTVKVYQLLSTQSEDQGDSESHLTDRRISLQMSRQENNERLSMDVSGTTNDKSCDPRMILRDPSKIDGPSNLGKINDRRVATDESAASTPVRKLSSPGEVGPTQRFLGDVAGTSVALGGRPIYPYCPYSPYGSPQGSPRNRRRPLRESRRVSIDNRQGALQLNQYKLLDNIGQGSYGIVKLAYNEEDGIHYAMKILSKKKLMKKAGIFGRMAPGKKGAANPLAKVYREIALLKKLDHPNVVKLVEVLDDPDEDNLYLVFELVQRGEVLQIPTDKPLDEDTARKNFRDVVMGVEYLHYQRIVHRDIKPSNLLLDSEGRIKIADLGVSAELRASGELLSGPAGTPAFAAPETTTPGAHYSGTLCDVWSMGVTLYSMVTGRLPWDGAGSIIGVQAAVRSEPLKFPEKPDLSENLRDIIVRMLAKDPLTRITLQGMKEHDWLTDHGMEPLPTEVDNCRLPVTVTDEEVERVVTRVPKLDTLILIKTMLKQHSFQNPFLPKRSGRSVCNDGESGSSESSSRSSGESLAQRDAAPRNLKTERFHRTGRSNSAPDSYDWQANGRQISVESPLPPVTEASSQEAEIERR